MANTVGTNELSSGVKVIISGEPFVVLDTEFVKPGKGQAFTRCKMRNLKTGRILDHTLKSGDSIEIADATETHIQYLYFDGSHYVFMATDGSCSQYDLDDNLLENIKQWLKEEVEYTAIIWNDQIIQVSLPNSMELEIVDTEPSVKGDTVSGGSKMATLSTGATIRVPLFVQAGEMIKLNPSTGEYIARS